MTNQTEEVLSPSRKPFGGLTISGLSWILYCFSLVGVALVTESVPFMGMSGMFAGGGRPALRLFVLGLPIAIAAILWGWDLAKGNVKLRYTPTLWLLAAFAGLSVASTLFAIDKRVAFFGYWLNEQGLVAWILFFALAFLGSQLITTRRRLVELAAVVVSSAAAVAAVALLEVYGFRPFPSYADSTEWMFQRGSSTMINPDFLGTFLVLPAVLAPALAAAVGGWRRWLAAAGAAVIWMSLVYSLTRGALLGALVGLVVLAVLRLTFARRTSVGETDGGATLLQKVAPWVLVVALIGVGVSFMGVQTIGERIDQSIEQITSPSFDVSGRLGIWKEMIPAVAARPLFGAGADNVLFAWQRFADKYSLEILGVHSLVDSAHNVYLDLALQFGVFFALAFVVAVGWLIVNASRKSSKAMQAGQTKGWVEFGFVAALAGLSVAFITGITVLPILAYAFACLGALMALDIRELREPRPEAARAWMVVLSTVAGLVAVVSLASGVSALAGNQASPSPAIRVKKDLAALKVAPWRQYPAYDMLSALQMLGAKDEPVQGMTVQMAHLRVLSIDSHNAARLYDYGDYKFLADRDPVTALQYANLALEERPNFAAALMLKGDALFGAQKNVEARDYLKAAIEVESRSNPERRWEAPWVSYMNYLANQSTMGSSQASEAEETFARFKRRFPDSESIPQMEQLVEKTKEPPRKMGF